jgi:hypothetical protein
LDISETEKDEYQSVKPQTLEEAEEKAKMEKILVEENQFVRYKRAKEIISREGLLINYELIEDNYSRI